MSDVNDYEPSAKLIVYAIATFILYYGVIVSSPYTHNQYLFHVMQMPAKKLGIMVIFPLAFHSLIRVN